MIFQWLHPRNSLTVIAACPISVCGSPSVCSFIFQHQMFVSSPLRPSLFHGLYLPLFLMVFYLQVFITTISTISNTGVILKLHFHWVHFWKSSDLIYSLCYLSPYSQSCPLFCISDLSSWYLPPFTCKWETKE